MGRRPGRGFRRRRWLAGAGRLGRRAGRPWRGNRRALGQEESPLRSRGRLDSARVPAVGARTGDMALNGGQERRLIEECGVHVAFWACWQVKTTSSSCRSPWSSSARTSAKPLAQNLRNATSALSCNSPPSSVEIAARGLEVALQAQTGETRCEPGLNQHLGLLGVGLRDWLAP